MSQDDIISRMCSLVPGQHDLELLQLTQALMKCQSFPGLEKARFLDVLQRGIPEFTRGHIPMYRTVVVTGGTGCIGHAVLSRLVKDQPYARYFSISRNPPIPERRVDRVNYLLGDIRDFPRMSQIMIDLAPDMVLHLAAQRDPGKAELEVDRTISTNVLGSSIVLRAAGEAGVQRFILASTGKAVRFFTSDVYAATKKMAEYQAAQAALAYGMRVGMARFTHVVDNSLIRIFIEDWILQGQPIRLHSPHVMLPIQSALECYHLLMMAGVASEYDHPKTLALRNLGWPPISLLDMTLDYLREADPKGPRCPLHFVGYPPGYEAYAYPGTYDPLTAGDVSTLINCVEAQRTKATEYFGDHIDEWEYTDGTSRCVDACLDALNKDAALGAPDLVSGLQAASEALLVHVMERQDHKVQTRIHRLGEKYDPAVKDHAYIHAQLTALLEATSNGKVL